MNNESVTLILKHSDISTNISSVSASSSAGSWTNGKQSTIWNINLRALMGDMFLKHDYFALRLNQLSYANANFPFTTNTDNQVIIKASGLNFINATYSSRTNNNSNQYQMVLVNIATSLATTMNFSPNVSMCNFKKSSENVQLTIDLIRCIDDLPAVYGATDKFPHMCYSFEIFPVNKI